MSSSTNLTPAAGDAPRVAFSCVVDRDPRFHVQAMIWYWTLRQHLALPPQSLFIQFTEGSDAELFEWFRAQGVQVSWVAPYAPMSPPLNKLRQTEIAGLEQHDWIVLSDCDKVYLPPFMDWVGGDSVRACSFVARPPFRIFEALYAARGLPPPRSVVRPIGPQDEADKRSPPNNVNGGTYIVPGPRWRTLAKAWRDSVDWIVERPELVERWSRNIDQIAFCMALDSLGWDVVELPKNFDLGVNVASIPMLEWEPDGAIGAIHYHSELGPDGRIQVGAKCHPALAAQVERINAGVQDLARAEPLFGRLAAAMR